MSVYEQLILSQSRISGISLALKVESVPGDADAELLLRVNPPSCSAYEGLILHKSCLAGVSLALKVESVAGDMDEELILSQHDSWRGRDDCSPPTNCKTTKGTPYHKRGVFACAKQESRLRSRLSLWLEIWTRSCFCSKVEEELILSQRRRKG